MRSRETEIKMSHCHQLYENVYYMLGNVDIPLFIMHSRKDITVPSCVIEEIRKKVNLCEIQEFENCKHWIHLDDEQGYFRALDNFIKRRIQSHSYCEKGRI